MQGETERKTREREERDRKRERGKRERKRERERERERERRYEGRDRERKRAWDTGDGHTASCVTYFDMFLTISRTPWISAGSLLLEAEVWFMGGACSDGVCTCTCFSKSDKSGKKSSSFLSEGIISGLI